VNRGDLSENRGDLSVNRGDVSENRGDLSVNRGDLSVNCGDLSVNCGDLSAGHEKCIRALFIPNACTGENEGRKIQNRFYPLHYTLL
jgi:hypothetical protein